MILPILLLLWAVYLVSTIAGAIAGPAGFVLVWAALLAWALRHRKG